MLMLMVAVHMEPVSAFTLTQLLLIYQINRVEPGLLVQLVLWRHLKLIWLVLKLKQTLGHRVQLVYQIVLFM